MIPYGKQNITVEDIAAVQDILQSDWLTQGPVVPYFEQSVANKVGAKHAVAVNSATSALHIACLSLGLQQGDWLWTSPNTFVASANCGLYCGAQIDFVDIDPHTYNMDADALQIKLEQAEKSGKLPKIIIPVHFAGQSCDMARIFQLSQKYGFKIIEDASHAIGGKYQDQPIGNCRYSNITIFSFHPVKIITTGEGGMAVTNDANLADQLMRYRSHGITRNPTDFLNNTDGGWYYEQQYLGFNYRMTELQAALGVSQLNRLEQFIIERRRLAENYRYLLQSLPLILPCEYPENYSAFHLYVVQLDCLSSSLSREALYDFLRDNGVGVNVHYIPVYWHPYYQQLGFKKGLCPVAEKYYTQALTLPLYYDLGDTQQELIGQILEKALSHEIILS